jgi:ubiquitin-like protein Pup
LGEYPGDPLFVHRVEKGQFRKKGRRMSQKRKQYRKGDPDDLKEIQGVPERQERKTSDDDDLIAEIDKVLEEDAEEFVRNYVQRGGE